MFAMVVRALNFWRCACLVPGVLPTPAADLTQLDVSRNGCRSIIAHSVERAGRTSSSVLMS